MLKHQLDYGNHGLIQKIKLLSILMQNYLLINKVITSDIKYPTLKGIIKGNSLVNHSGMFTAIMIKMVL